MVVAVSRYTKDDLDDLLAVRDIVWGGKNILAYSGWGDHADVYYPVGEIPGLTLFAILAVRRLMTQPAYTFQGFQERLLNFWRVRGILMVRELVPQASIIGNPKDAIANQILSGAGIYALE